MPENLLCDLDVAGGVEYALREGVTEEVRMNRDACLSTDVAQGRFETRIAKRFALTFPRSDPNGMNVRRCAAFGAQVLFINRPEIIGDGHTVPIASTLQPHGDEAPLAIDVLQFHAQNPMSASKRTPIAEYRVQSRAGKGVINVKTTERNGKVVGVLSVTEDSEVMLISQQGKIARLDAGKIRESGRSAQGVKLLSLEEGDQVAAACLVSETGGNGGPAATVQ